MATNDIYRLSVESTFTGVDQIVNVFHYRQTTAGIVTANKAQALIDAWQAEAETAYLACLSARITLVLLAARGVFLSIEQAEETDTSNGTLPNGDITPLQTSPLISWRTGLAGRRRRGRTYMPPIPETEQDAGNLGAGMITALEAFVTDALLVSNGVGDAFELVIWSPEDPDATPPRVGNVVSLVTAGVVRDVMGTQRRRRQGTGS